MGTTRLRRPTRPTLPPHQAAPARRLLSDGSIVSLGRQSRPADSGTNSRTSSRCAVMSKHKLSSFKLFLVGVLATYALCSCGGGEQTSTNGDPSTGSGAGGTGGTSGSGGT